METIKNTITPEFLQGYCKEHLSKTWTLKECSDAIRLAINRGATTPRDIREEAINFLYY